MVEPLQTWAGPTITPGVIPTVTGCVATQPVGGINEMIDVPGALPVTTPPEVIGATPGRVLDHTPGTEVVKVSRLPWHTVPPPLITGVGLTVTSCVA